MRRSLSAAESKRIAATYGWRCAACGELLPAAFQIDHVVPLADGGADDESNMQSLCPGCHADKTQREAIRRAKARRPAADSSLACARCGASVSPYFTHRCPGPRSARGAR